MSGLAATPVNRDKVLFVSHQEFDITLPLESGLYVRDYTLAWISHSGESMHHVRQIHPGVYETLYTYGTVIRQKTIPL